MIPQFPHASESFKRDNPHLFPPVGTEQDLSLVEPPAPSRLDLKLEKELQEQIIGFLERNNTVVIRSRTDRKTSTNVGTPDLLFAVKGRATAFEVKRPGEKPTKEQKEMMARMTSDGWDCYVVDSYDQGREIFEKISG